MNLKEIAKDQETNENKYSVRITGGNGEEEKRK